MFIKEMKNSIVVGAQSAHAKPVDANGYTYAEITQSEYESILQEFAERESQ